MAVNKFDNSMFDSDAIGTTANQLVQLDGSAKIPAVDGSLLTSIPSAFTKSASDPTVSTNPSGGVGTIWVNTTSGETYCCTDATAGANVWTNVGAGTGDVEPIPFYPVSTYGYLMAGNVNPATSTVNHIQRFSTTSDANATDWADLSYARSYPPAGQRSEDYGFCAGGSSPSQPGFNSIDKFPFASQTNATDIGNLTTGRGGSTGASSGTYCYTCVGHGGSVTNIIDKFSVSSTGNATDVGDCLVAGTQGYSHSTEDYGWSAGGSRGGYSNIIQKFPFATDANATDVADLTVARAGRVSSSSVTHGYSGAGEGNLTRLDKYSFAAGTNATTVGTITGATSPYGTGGCASSVNNGYAASGHVTNAIDKWSHTTDGNAVDIADVAVPVNEAAGTHG